MSANQPQLSSILHRAAQLEDEAPLPLTGRNRISRPTLDYVPAQEDPRIAAAAAAVSEAAEDEARALRAVRARRRADAINVVARARADGGRDIAVASAEDADAAYDIADILHLIAGAPVETLSAYLTPVTYTGTGHVEGALRAVATTSIVSQRVGPYEDNSDGSK